ncbi:PREDICTED: uncharacterized protein LOC106813338 [Priapulus caudatus]|uniref:Uncharacterized protein LOC106813338 n=1 Tax=Priapulus caudatus TaxID=37621 RepID=A0ABM1EL79_PRICU|nr:PREDICTED: uncharacterized protein LOC106813338 [Priapulus caudatus]
MFALHTRDIQTHALALRTDEMQQQHVTSQCCHDAAHGYTDPLLIDCSLQYAMPVYLQQLAVAYPDGALTLMTQHLPDLTASFDMSLSSSDESFSDSYVDGHGDRATSPLRIDYRRAGVYEDDEDESEDVVRVADTSPMLDDSFSLSSQHGFAAPSILNFIEALNVEYMMSTSSPACCYMIDFLASFMASDGYRDDS